MDYASALERTATVCLTLLDELQRSNQHLQDHDDCSQYAEFLVKLSHRIRTLEANVCQQLTDVLAGTLADNTNNNNDSCILGCCIRGLVILSKSKEVESIFARTASMKVIRNTLSLGSLDAGGSRGECAGLQKTLDELLQQIKAQYGSILDWTTTMFACEDGCMEVDLVTAGVWVPIATALLADPAIKMAVFSPGIARILQSNYVVLDSFLASLAENLLTLDDDTIQAAQDRIYSHPKTAEFAKKWNLPIYYQLRFGECCTRLNDAIDGTQAQGWIANVFTGSDDIAESMKQTVGFELSLFMELYDTLLGLWLPDVILKPLTNRFLRGAVQLVGRVVSFISDGMEGKILFGEQPQEEESSKESNGVDTNGETTNGMAPPPSYSTRKPYCWGESGEDVAAVAWELTILESTLQHDYVTSICDALSNGRNDTSETEQTELRGLVRDVFKETAQQIHPIIDKAWNGVIVDLLTKKCSAPLAAVKGVAATYRMTNRPPPTQASPFVATILRPIKEFDKEFCNRTPDRIGARWKQNIVTTIADRYAVAVEDLIATVKRTEVALRSRNARRTAVGGMSDGEKVTLQLYLDCLAFAESIREVGLEPATIVGLSKLKDLTAEGEKLRAQAANGNGTR